MPSRHQPPPAVASDYSKVVPIDAACEKAVCQCLYEVWAMFATTSSGSIAGITDSYFMWDLLVSMWGVTSHRGTAMLMTRVLRPHPGCASACALVLCHTHGVPGTAPGQPLPLADLGYEEQFLLAVNAIDQADMQKRSAVDRFRVSVMFSIYNQGNAGGEMAPRNIAHLLMDAAEAAVGLDGAGPPVLIPPPHAMLCRAPGSTLSKQQTQQQIKALASLGTFTEQHVKVALVRPAPQFASALVLIAPAASVQIQGPDPALLHSSLCIFFLPGLLNGALNPQMPLKAGLIAQFSAAKNQQTSPQPMPQALSSRQSSPKPRPPSQPARRGSDIPQASPSPIPPLHSSSSSPHTSAQPSPEPRPPPRTVSGGSLQDGVPTVESAIRLRRSSEQTSPQPIAPALSTGTTHSPGSPQLYKNVHKLNSNAVVQSLMPAQLFGSACVPADSSGHHPHQPDISGFAMNVIHLIHIQSYKTKTVSLPVGLLDTANSGHPVTPAVWEQLCTAVTSALLSSCSSALAAVDPPCKVFGDIHGQLNELLTMMKVYSLPDHRQGDMGMCSYVFLGDFVDRGQQQLETVLYLLCLKLNPPGVLAAVGTALHVFAPRKTNRKYGFRETCLKKYGPEHGEAVWEAINKAFDCLPCAITVGGDILCMHGGLGRCDWSLSELAGIRLPVEPSFGKGRQVTEWPRAMQIFYHLMWSDPWQSRPHELQEPAPGGGNVFWANDSRGWEFDLTAYQEWCRRNGIKYVIRAHQCFSAGIQFFDQGRLITVFSASNYSARAQDHPDRVNDAGFVMINRHKVIHAKIGPHYTSSQGSPSPGSPARSRPGRSKSRNPDDTWQYTHNMSPVRHVRDYSNWDADAPEPQDKNFPRPFDNED
eukprot:gene5570-997_t